MPVGLNHMTSPVVAHFLWSIPHSAGGEPYPSTGRDLRNWLVHPVVVSILQSNNQLSPKRNQKQRRPGQKWTSHVPIPASQVRRKDNRPPASPRPHSSPAHHRYASIRARRQPQMLPPPPLMHVQLGLSTFIGYYVSYFRPAGQRSTPGTNTAAREVEVA